MTTIDVLKQFLDGQFQAWNRQDEEHQRAPAGPVIAITREPGCGGARIAQALAQELGLVLYDGKMVEEIAKDAHVSEQVVATLDEKVRSELDDWLSSFSGSTALSSTQYLQSLRRVLFAIATHGNAIILGRGANFLLPAEKKTLGICLVAPLERRILNIARELQLSPEDARRHIARTEKERRLLVKEIGCGDITDVTNYHIVINTALISDETIVQIAKEIINSRPGLETRKP